MENQNKQTEKTQSRFSRFLALQDPVEFFKSRRVGFYLSCAAALLLLIAATVYGICYRRSVYGNTAACVLAGVGVALFVLLTVPKTTRRYAPIVLFVFSLTAFLLFVQTSYLYFSEVFFGGAAGIANMRADYAVSLLFFLLASILSNIGIFMKSGKEEPAV